MANSYPPTIIEDGTIRHDLTGPEFRTLTPSRQSSTSVLASGASRRDVFFPLQLRAQYPDDLLPEERIFQRMALDYSLLGIADQDLLEDWRHAPRVQLTLIDWARPSFPAFTGDGERRVLRQYHVQAADLVTLPPLSGVEPRTPEVNRSVPELYLNGASIPLTGVDQAMWDAFEPLAGEAWWLLGSVLWRFADVPPLNAKIRTQYLPARRVVEEVAADQPVRTQAASALDPRRLVLVESV
jgi:hypothetical protein